MTVVLHTSDGKKALGDDVLMVFADETGHEYFADTNYPIFGFGGCVVASRLYKAQIYDRWRAMKQRFFGGPETPLHGSDLRPSPRQIRGLRRFFTKGAFGRVACTAGVTTSVDGDISHHAVVALNFVQNKLSDLPHDRSIRRVAIIFEDSQRGNKYLFESLAGQASTTLDCGPYRRECPIDYFLADKAAGLEGLEVADFIAHAAGAFAKKVNTGEQGWPDPKHFRLVFKECHPHWSSYIHINSVVESERDQLGPKEPV